MEALILGARLAAAQPNRDRPRYLPVPAAFTGYTFGTALIWSVVAMPRTSGTPHDFSGSAAPWSKAEMEPTPAKPFEQRSRAALRLAPASSCESSVLRMILRP